MTDIGFTGGGKDSGMFYIDGKKVNKLANTGMINKLIELVEDKANLLELKKET
jgi:(E)-4-hydroxy-3-methylbut-2-enyl-diphosphate synthase